MNKAFLILALCFSCFTGNDLFAEKSPQYLLVETKSGQTRKVHNYDKFSFKDSSGHEKEGRIYLLNDSQFCFVNYFYEVASDTFHKRDIYKVFFQPVHKRVIPLGVKIVGALFIPYVGLGYLIISEIHRASVIQKNRGSGYNSTGWYKKDEFSVSIKGFYAEA